LHAYRDSSYGKGVFLENRERHYVKLAENFARLVHELPPMSPLRQPIIHALGREISPMQLQQLLGVSKRTIFRARRVPLQETLLFALKSSNFTNSDILRDDNRGDSNNNESINNKESDNNNDDDGQENQEEEEVNNEKNRIDTVDCDKNSDYNEEPEPKDFL